MKQSDLTIWTCWRIDAVAGLLCVGASLVRYFVGLHPLMEQHSASAVQEQQLAREKFRSSELAASVLLLKKQLAVTRQELSEIKIRLYPVTRVNARIAELTELLGECGLKANMIELGQIVHADRYDMVPITMAGYGDYRSCAAFIQRLCQTYPDTRVASFLISGVPNGPVTTGSFRFELSWHAAPTARRAAS